jgi:AbiV family abortive infection protein
MSLSLAKLDELIDALLKNAAALVTESGLLGQHGHFARAHALAHMAREELAKSIMLQAAAFKVLAGHRVDWGKLMKRFRSHDEKLKLENVQSAVILSALGKTDQSSLVLHHTSEFAKHRNQRKNTALYVELTEGAVSLPSEQFSEKQASRTHQLALIWLQEQQAMRDKIGPYHKRDPKQFKGMQVPDPEQLVTGDPSELLGVLGAAHAAIWAEQDKDRGQG